MDKTSNKEINWEQYERNINELSLVRAVILRRLGEDGERILREYDDRLLAVYNNI